jgi:hypothetical protein
LTKGFDYFYFKLNRTASYSMKQMDHGKISTK